MFTVKVIERSSGRPVKSKKVSVIFNGLFRGCAKDQYTFRSHLFQGFTWKEHQLVRVVA